MRVVFLLSAFLFSLRDKIFQLFFPTKPAGQGIGLGLRYDIVKAHGGTITVNSNQPPGRTISANSFYRPPGGSISVTSNYREPGSISVNSINSPQGGQQGGQQGAELKLETATAKMGRGSEFIIELPDSL